LPEVVWGSESLDMDKHLVSIIMNCYNSDRFLKEAIDSVYAQTYSSWEIIFWDNASTDHSADIAQSYGDKVKYYLSPENTPLGEARNKALKKATGKYVAFLDCDDLYLPNKLQSQIQLMDNNDYALCYGSAIIINEDGKEIRRVAVKNKSGYRFGMLLKHYEINMQSVIIRRSILAEEKINFITHLKYNPDYNLFMTIASRYQVGVIKDCIVKYRVWGESLSNKTIDIAASETKFTLDQIVEYSPILKVKFPNEFIQAYAKVTYYETIAFLIVGNRSKAINTLRPILFVRYEYFLFFTLLLTPLSLKLMLKILGR
jgi:glycosyltransferase involved in cell wall biosynthesis